jgi:iron complex outermembrane recepter protein
MKVQQIAARRSSLSIVFAALTIASSDVLFAQENDSDGAESEVVDEIIVTADKRSAKSIQDLSGSITAFDAQKLERLDVLDFDDFIVQVPGTNFINDGGPGRGNEVASIRGLSTVADNTVGVVAQYLDGAPHFGNSYRFFDIGEVGVLRGPQGTLWGSQSIGGLIYYRSNRPVIGEFSGNIQGEVYSSSDDGGASQRISGVVNIPLVEDKFALRLAGQFIDESGYIDNVRTSTNDINDVEETAWRVSALFEPTDTVSITGIYHGNDLETDAPTYIEIAQGGLRVDQPSDFGPTLQEYDLFNLIVDVDLGWGTLNYTGSQFANDGSYSDFDDSSGALVRTSTTIDEEASTHELRLASAGDSPLQWIVGFYSDEYDDFNQAIDSTLLDLNDPAPVEGVTSGGLVIRKDQAFFGEVSYDFTDQFRLLVGGRFFDWEVDNREVFLIGGSDFGFVTNGVASDNDFFHKVSLEYRFNDDVMGYALRSEGFRFGGFNTFVGEALFGISEEFFEFGPDTLVNYEVGIKSQFADNRVLLNASVYFLDWQGVQAVVQSDTAGAFGQGFFTTNSPDLEATGFELEIVTQDLIAPGVYGSMSWGYTDNEFQDDAQLFAGTRVTINKGDSLRRTPRNTYSLDLGYEFEVGVRANGYVRANFWHKDSTATAGFNGNDGDVNVPAQDVVNISGGVIWDTIRLKLYVDNVTDETPFLNVFSGGSFGNPGADQAVRANTIRPRTIGLEATYYFGM